MKKMMMMMTVCALALCGATAAFAADVDTPQRLGDTVALTAGAAIDAGEMVAVWTNSLLYPAADAAGYAVIGRAENAAAAAARVTVRRGVFRWENYGDFTAADIGTTCYVSNNVGVTTAAVAGNDVPAGVIVDVDTEGVWVDTYNRSVQLTSSVSALTVTGNAAVGGTLAVTGNATAGGTFAITGNTTVGGTLGVTGVMTLTDAPKVTAVTAAGTVTATMTNAPALVSADSPAWVTVSIGTNSYVVPAFKLE